MGKTPVPTQEGQQSGAAQGSPSEKRRKFHSLMGQVVDLRRLRAAYEAVRSNRGEPGVDGVTVDAFGENLEANLAALVVELRAQTYRPQPVRRVWIPKPDGDQRPLGIPAVRDRVVQQAVRQVLEPIFEADFSSHSHGFRPGRSAFSALRELYGQVRDGHVWIVDVDIEKFFDEIPHEPLIEAVAARVADGSVLRLVRLFLEALIQDGYRLVRPKAGTPQGGVVSPLLANIYLARLDRALEADGASFVRYADDVRLTSRTEAGAREALERTREVLQELGLRLSERKTKLVTLSQGVDFLGYRLVARKRHLNVWINPKAVERFREEVRRLTRRTAGKSLRAMVSRLNRYVRGWGEYFKRAEASGVFDRHDRWITRRLRAYVAKRWRNGLWRRYPDQYFWFQLGLTRLYHLRRDFIRELEARRRAGNRPVERSAGNPHATFVRGTEASS
ncbi:MAG TPA: group II intron reverse transcriptase/maturase [Gemmatimonadaceae bacterium]|nr:group II intron reverse transcriptase/maturase [Gemmatimonadaceae bacterium]